MKIALAQIAPGLGTLAANLELHLSVIEKARRRKAGLVVFPELSLTGYRLRDLVESAALDPDRAPAFRALKKAGRGIDIVVGFVEERPGEPGLFFNSAAYISGGAVRHIHRKVYLPTFGMFEEARFFAAGRDFRAFASPLGKAGLLICRDFLQLNSGYLLFAGGAEILITISAAPGRGLAAPGRFASSRMWELMGEALARFTTSFVVYCNRVGLEDGAAFAGGSFVFSPFGRLLAQAPYFDNDLLFAECDPAEVRKARKTWTWKRDDRPDVALLALQRMLIRHDD